MSVSLVSRNVARKLLLVQLLVVIASDICLASPGAYTSERPCGLDIRIWRSFQSSGDVGVTCGGVGGFKGGILAADRYVGFGAGGSDTGTGCN